MRFVVSFYLPVLAILWISFLLGSTRAMAQHRGGHGAGGSIPGGTGRPSGVDEKDALKDFHEAMAVQATPEQVTRFQALLKEIETVRTELQKIADQRPAHDSASQSRATKFDPSLESTRAESKKFLQTFSDKQKSGLKEAMKRIDKADSSLEEEGKKLDQALAAPAANELSAHLTSVGKALDEFSNQELALGREMGIVLASGQDLTFNLPVVKSIVRVASRPIEVSVSGELSQTSVQGSQRTFNLELLANLTDLQQNITELLRAQLDQSSTCGENLAVPQAFLTSSSPSSTVLLKLHYERWSCLPIAGQSIAQELVESDGSVEIKLVPAVEPNGTLKLAATFGQIQAEGLMGDAIRSGNLSNELRDKVSQSLLSTLRAAADFKTVLPPAVQDAVALQNVRFKDSVGTLDAVFEGQVQISDDQADQLARQLNQTVPAQGTAPH
jgi:hypothetical protein